MTLILYHLLSDCVINNDRQRWTKIYKHGQQSLTQFHHRKILYFFQQKFRGRKTVSEEYEKRL